jgi:Ras family protein T1
VDSDKHVIICGTKDDLIENEPSESCRIEQEKRELQDFLQKFSFVISCFHCSAKSNDAEKVFYHSEISVLYPTSPIFDTSNSTFTNEAILCFLRIFRTFDMDQDGLLNNSELSLVHKKCFEDANDELNLNDINALKKQIENYSSHRNNHNHVTPEFIKKDSITFDGFLAMMAIFIEAYKPQIPWIMLEKFGYDEKLHLMVHTYLLYYIVNDDAILSCLIIELYFTS